MSSICNLNQSNKLKKQLRNKVPDIYQSKTYKDISKVLGLW